MKTMYVSQVRSQKQSYELKEKLEKTSTLFFSIETKTF